MININNPYKLYGIENIKIQRINLGTRLWNIEHLNNFLEWHNGKIIDIHFANNENPSNYIPPTYAYVMYVDDENLEELET